MAANFRIDEAQLVSLWMEAISYGIYLVTLGLCIRALFWGSTGKKEYYNWPLIIVAFLMCFFLTFDVSISLKHILDAFIFFQGPGGPDGFFGEISEWVNVMKSVDTEVMALIGDGMMIYRCLVVFGWKWLVVAVPILMWLANAALAGMITFIEVTLHTNTLLSTSKISPLTTTFLVITLVLNLLTTGLIVWRIWSIDKKTSILRTVSSSGSGNRSRLANVVRIVLESGTLYTILVLITFGCDVANSNALYGVSNVMIMIIGICFNLIIIRVDQGVAFDGTNAKSLLSSTAIPLNLRSSQSGYNSYPRPPVEVMISNMVDTEIGKDGKDTGSITMCSSTGTTTTSKVQFDAI